MIEKNVGQTDKTLRIVAGLVLLVLAFASLKGVAAAIVGIVGVVLIATGATGRCPGYSLMGMNTCGMDKKA